MADSMMSSPDPLNDSPTFNSPPKRRSSRVRHSFPLQGSSPKKQTFELDVGNQLSPQKIRVTVEADGSDIENYIDIGDAPSSPTRRPSNRRREHTTTTTIPVKGLSDSEDEVLEVTTPKRGRGRPRKSAITPVPKKKRANTPTKKSSGRRKSIGSLIDGDDSADISFRIGQGVEIGRGKGASRSRSTKGASRKSTPAAKHGDNVEEVASSTTSKGRGRRKTLLPEDVAVLEDTSSGADGSAIEEHEGVLEPINTNSGCVPSANSTVRSTVTSDGEVPDIVLARFHPGNETPRKPGWSSPRVVEAAIPSSSRSRNADYPSPSVSPDKCKSVEMDRSMSHGHAVGQHTNKGDEPSYEDENDGIGELPEFDTILESEGFSMISVDSVPSLREHLSSPPTQGEQEETPEPKPLPFAGQSESSIQQARPDNSYSKITPRTSAKTTPAKTLAAKLLARQSSRASFKPSPSGPSTYKQGPGMDEMQNEDDDEFSEIPSAILQAVTPAAQRQIQELTAGLKVPKPPSRRVSSKSADSSHSRLPSPEETPSPPLEGSISEKGESAQQPPMRDIQEDDSNNYSQIRSSPPPIAPNRFTYTAHIREHRALNPNTTQTPSIVFSSPTLPPRLPALAIPATDNARPVLSPILRAGQVLQNIVVPSSPRSRSQSLGSPFKSPVAGRKSSPMVPQNSSLSPTNERRPLPRVDLSSQLSGRSSERRREEDPFNTNALGSSPEQKQRYSLDLPKTRAYSDPRLDQFKAGGDNLRSDDAMSWQAEEEVSIPESFVPTRANSSALRSSPKLTPEQRWEAERAAVRKQAAIAEDVIVIDSDEERSQQEVDDLLLETLNSSSPIVSRQEPVKETTERPRRGKIPSPWRKNSKRLVYSDEPSQFTSPPDISKPALFRNPPTVESKPQPVTVRRVAPPELSDSLDDADLSSWQIPQKSNFKPRARESPELDISALLTASPLKKLPTLSGSSTGAISRPQSSSGETAKLKLFSARTQTTEMVQKDTSQPAGFTPIAQKAGFNPRPRSESPVKPTFPSMLVAPTNGSSSTSSCQPLSTSSHSKTNALPSRQLFSPPVSEDDSLSSDTNNKENLARTHEWAASLKQSAAPLVPKISLTPSRPISPSKSCLKTPSWDTLTQESPSKGVTFVSSSPMPDDSEIVQLSGTTWSKAHWTLLDSILQSWKPSSSPTSPDSSSGSSTTENEPLDRRGSYSGAPRLRRRNSTRVISKLLGKNVFSKGESMRLEQWHLEVVDEFRGVVEGWEEKVIAMRVFALVMGEKRRAERAGTQVMGEGEAVRV